MMMPRFSRARCRFSPANSSICLTLSTPSAHCDGGYSTRTWILGHRRSRRTDRKTTSASPGNVPSASIVVSKSLHSHSRVSMVSSIVLPSRVVVVTATAAMESPARMPAAAALPPSYTSETMVSPYPSSRPPASSVSSMPRPPARVTARPSRSSTKWSLDFESMYGVPPARAADASALTDTVHISAASSIGMLYLLASTTPSVRPRAVSKSASARAAKRAVRENARSLCPRTGRTFLSAEGGDKEKPWPRLKISLQIIRVITEHFVLVIALSPERLYYFVTPNLNFSV
mmetsp:Transcript_25350/g.50505  ORF Transcript_25350/g.50505 Transcript_25350/m.50505 type:complete len:288 (+) Transcript_25350:424-1287(+)